MTERSLWSNRVFVGIWGSQSVNQMGSQVSVVVLPLIAIVTLGVSPFGVALLGFAMTLPVLLCGLPFGVLVDRVSHRPLLIASHGLAAVTMAAIPIMYIAGGLSLASLCVVAGLAATFSLLYEFAATAYLPEFLPKTQLFRANSLIESSRSVAESTGPMAGGVLVSVIAAPYVMLLDSLSFAISALLLWIARPTRPSIDKPAGELACQSDSNSPSDGRSSIRAFFVDSRDGFRFVIRNPILRAVALGTTWLNLFSSMATVLQMIYMLRVLGMSPAEFGLVLGIGNSGAVIAAILSVAVSRRVPIGKLLVFSAALTGAAYFLVPAAPQSDPIPFLIAAGFLGALTGVWFNITVLTVRQAVTPKQFRGRSIAVLRLAVWGSIPLGSLLAGVASELVPIRTSLWIAASGAAACVVWLLWSPVARFTIGDEPSNDEGADDDG